ncbi:hypothetical protein CEQ90_19600 [Lewinellaceae bacterium SD302]|nr:hypothetical protein CEQ90_19600 [Lewinellaceae bacterium SD302]
MLMKNCFGKLLIAMTLFCVFNTVESQESQNLVPNGSFEELYTCPEQTGDFDNLMFWKRKSITPDVFSYCSNNPFIQPPIILNTFIGVPYTGEAMAGIYTFSNFNDVSESFTVELIEPLKYGVYYYFSFMHKVPSLNNSSDFSCISKTINACFTYSINENVYQNCIYEYGDLDDEDLVEGEWVKRDAIIRGSGEIFLEVGNVYNIEQSVSYSFCPSSDIITASAYNLVDDFEMHEIIALPDTIYYCDSSSLIQDIEILENEKYYLNGIEVTTSSINYSIGLNILMIDFGNVTYFDTTFVTANNVSSASNSYEIILCEGESVNIENFFSGYNYDSILINGREQAVIENAGSYFLTLFNPCGYDTSFLSVVETKCSCNIFIPNSFSPNGDGINDLFRVYDHCENSDIEYERLTIYDRWGGVVSKSENRSEPYWDGKTSSGQVLPEGIYIYLIEYKLARYDGQNYQQMSKAGEINLFY